MPHRDRFVATTKSQTKVSSSPPPVQTPSTAAIVTGNQVVDDIDGLLVHPNLLGTVAGLEIHEPLHIVAGAERVTGSPDDQDPAVAIDSDLLEPVKVMSGQLVRVEHLKLPDACSELYFSCGSKGVGAGSVEKGGVQPTSL
jgi:hypothetical protein